MKSDQFRLLFFLVTLARGCGDLIAQNLVPNPGFENLSECPDLFGQLDRAVGWSGFQVTPDLFNVCAEDFVSVPANHFGSQWPAEGDGYAGLYCYYAAFENSREYAGIQLVAQLTPGVTTFVSFKTILSGIGTNYITAYACNGIGAKFSVNSWHQKLQGGQPPGDPHIYTTDVVGPSGWTVVSGSFIPDSAYAYIAIGNFFSDENTEVVPSGLPGADFGAGYYYVDDICVSQVNGVCDGATMMGSVNTVTIVQPYYDASSASIILRSGNGMGIDRIEVLDTSGRLVFSKSSGMNADRMELPAKELLPGVYIVRSVTGTTVRGSLVFVP